jgi:Tfp pilus assembly protein PilF
MLRTVTAGAVALCWMCWMTIGCAPEALPHAGAPGPSGEIPPAARKSFVEGLAGMARHDRAGDWTEASCKETAALFTAAGGAAAAIYDAGMALRRCHKDAEAEALFRAALAQDPALYQARAALALVLSHRAGQLDGAIAELGRAVRDARFSDADALTALATLQMRRENSIADNDGANDLARAMNNLHRALAIDDTSMPALNQLALLHLERARRAGAATGRDAAKKTATGALEMAALVCAQAIAKNPRWAPIHNTAGLVEVELGNLSRAAASFDEARRLDPRLVEAQMNVAALNLQVRGFARAEEAYRAVLALRPDDYDARLGLALAIRGQIDQASEAERVAAAGKEIAAAKRIAPDRPEAYFNEAILVQEYGGRSGTQADATANLARARDLYNQFLARAEGTPALAGARERAKERLRDIEQIGEVVRGSQP